MKQKTCLYCGGGIKQKPHGRNRKFCDNSGRCKRMYNYHKGKSNDDRKAD